ncbi:MAG: flagellar hook-basal body complex protein [Rhodospirillales bacterium]|nr:flagellar hook-basal body complex protein [Rhodospirillales bacterium]
MGFSLFTTSTLGMMSQAHALDTISSNIANVSTGGYKRTDTRFSTVLSDTLTQGAGTSLDRSLGGVKPKDFATINQQGLLKSTERDLDLAIAGNGFFQISRTEAVSTEILFTRDGSFEVNASGTAVPAIADDGSTIQVKQGFLTDKNGYFLLGIAPETDGSFLSTGALTAMRVDGFAFANQFSATTAATLAVNLPSGTNFGDTPESISLTVVDSNGKRRALTASFSKTPTANKWKMDLSGDNLTTSALAPGAAFSLAVAPGSGRTLTITPGARQIKAFSEQVPSAGYPGAFQGLKVGDPITLSGTTSNNSTFTISAISADFTTVTVSTGTPLAGLTENLTTANVSSTRVVGSDMIFSATGKLTSPTTFTPALTWSDGATNSFALDISNSTQLNGDFTLGIITQNGLSASTLSSVKFDNSGRVIGEFKDGTSRSIFKIPLATFPNVNGLETQNGNTFAESQTSGAARSVFSDESGIALLAPNTVELSNVEISTQFTQMIQVQQAYNSSATAFKTADEMLMAARDLKT